MTDQSNDLRAYLSAKGRQGGQSRSEAKRLAALANLAKANQAKKAKQNNL